MASSPEEIRKHMKTYGRVGLTLGLFTVITLVMGVVPIFDFGAPGRGGIDVVLTLLIAGFKSSLVMLIFMHLNQEKGLIYKTLAFTAVFVGALLTLTLFAQAAPIRIHPGAASKEEVKPLGPRVRVLATSEKA